MGDPGPSCDHILVVSGLPVLILVDSRPPCDCTGLHIDYISVPGLPMIKLVLPGLPVTLLVIPSLPVIR